MVETCKKYFPAFVLGIDASSLINDKEAPGKNADDPFFRGEAAWLSATSAYMKALSDVEYSKQSYRTSLSGIGSIVSSNVIPQFLSCSGT